MRIQHNITALNAHRNYGINNNSISKNVEKLSSGYRINRAGDDAAGLAISEKMRAQIRGLTMASKNAQDGVSLIQTAEGGLQSAHDVLQRMRELAVQGGNDTNVDLDREQIQNEINQLTKELDRIGHTTTFNERVLLDGSLDEATATSTTGGVPTKGQEIPLSNIADLNGIVKAAVATGDAVTGGSDTITATYVAASKASVELDLSAINFGDSSATSTQATNLTFTLDGKNINLAEVAARLKVDETDNITDFNASDGMDDDEAKALLQRALNEAGLSEKYKIEASSTANALVLTAKDKNTEIEIANEITLYSADQSVAAVDNLIDTTNADGRERIELVATSGELDQDGKTTTTAKIAIGQSNDRVILTSSGGDAKFELDLTAIASKQDEIEDAGEGGKTYEFSWNDMTAEELDEQDEITIGGSASGSGSGQALNLQVGANSGLDQVIQVSIKGVSTDILGLTKGLVTNATNTPSDKDVEKATLLSVKDITAAQDALTKIDNALNDVSTQRSKLGAVQNRLEYTIGNLDTAAENITSAESRIRDVDMAKEMTNFSKNNILAQASTAMLAQANSLPQSVLQLLG